MELTRVVLSCPNTVPWPLDCGALLPVGSEVVAGAVLPSNVVVVETAPRSQGTVGADTVVIAARAQQHEEEERKLKKGKQKKKPLRLLFSPFARSSAPVEVTLRPSSSRKLEEGQARVSKDSAAALGVLNGAVAVTHAEDGGEEHPAERGWHCVVFGEEDGEEEEEEEDEPTLYLHPRGYADACRSVPYPDKITGVPLLRTCSTSELPEAVWVELSPADDPWLLPPHPRAAETALQRYLAAARRDRAYHLGDVVTVSLLDCPAPYLALSDRARAAAALPTAPPKVDFVVTAAAGKGDALLVVPFKMDVGGGTEVTLRTRPVAAPAAPYVASPLPVVTCTEQYRTVRKYLEDVFASGTHGSILVTGGAADGAGDVVPVAGRAVGARVTEVSGHACDASDALRLLRTCSAGAPTVVHVRHGDSLLPSLPESLPALQNVVFAVWCDSVPAEEAQDDEPDPSPPSRSAFHLVVKAAPPPEGDRRSIFETVLLPRCPSSPAATPASLAKLTAGLPLAGLPQVSALAVLKAADRVGATLPDQFLLPAPVDYAAAVKAYTEVRNISVSTNVQKVAWKDIGGLKEPKREIMECIHLPMTQPHLFSDAFKPRKGILMYGPPGCGKTLLAKGVATECGLNFMSVKGPELLNMYVGESERNIRELFEKARHAAPCVVFFDELDALVPNRGANGDSGGVMDRVVAQLLMEVDSLSGSPSEFVFIVAATNRPDLIDQSLLRPGRFDRCVYLGVSTTDAEQATILKAQTRKMNLAPDVDFLSLVADMPKTYSGADLYALSTEALMLAMQEHLDELVEGVRAQREKEGREEEEEEEDKDEEEATASPPPSSFNNIPVHQAHFVAARATACPSITESDLRRYQSLKHQFS